jgi:hypothetical protein
MSDIETPRGMVVTDANGEAKLVWNTNFVPDWTKRYSEAQKFIDSEVLRLSEPFTPLRTGTLIKTGILGTVVGSGEVSWIAPYARSRYYSSRPPGSSTGALRGSFWFERMKAVWGTTIISGARKIVGKGK